MFSRHLFLAKILQGKNVGCLLRTLNLLFLHVWICCSLWIWWMWGKFRVDNFPLTRMTSLFEKQMQFEPALYQKRRFYAAVFLCKSVSSNRGVIVMAKVLSTRLWQQGANSSAGSFLQTTVTHYQIHNTQLRFVSTAISIQNDFVLMVFMMHKRVHRVPFVSISHETLKSVFQKFSGWLYAAVCGWKKRWFLSGTRGEK